MEKHILSADDAANYHNDETRSEIRKRLTVKYPEGVLVVTQDDELLDTLGPANPDDESTEIGLAVMLTDEEKEEIEQTRLLEEQEIAHYELEVKPKVIQKITNDVRKEFRDSNREKTNEILELRSKLAKLQRESASTFAQMKKEVEDTLESFEQLNLIHEQALKSNLGIQKQFDETLAELNLIHQTLKSDLELQKQFDETLAELNQLKASK